MDDGKIMIRVYFRSSCIEEGRTDDEDMPILNSVGGDMLQIKEIDVRDYEGFTERENAAAGEEGGHFEVFVVTGYDGRILPDGLVKSLSRHWLSADAEGCDPR